MKNKKLIVALAALITFGGITIAWAAPIVTYQDTLVPFTDNQYDLGTSTQAWRNIYTNNINITGTCTGCGGSGGGSGSVSTSTHEVSGQVPFFTSNSATPALIGGDPQHQWDNTNKVLLLGSSSPTTYTGTAFVGTGNINNFYQTILQNTNAGNLASADYIVGGNLTTNSSYYGDLGYNSSGNADPNFTAFGPNELYLYNSDADTDIAAASSTGSANIKFFTGGSLAANERARITSTGLFGIGTSTPWGLLSINPTSANGAAPAFAIGSSTGTSFVVTNAGKIGIGTTTSASMLSIETPNTTTSGFYINTPSSPTANIVNIFGNSIPALVVDFNRRIGIGTTSPSRQLSLEAAGGSFIRIQRNDSAVANGAIEFTGNDALQDAFISYNNTVAQAISFATGAGGATSRMVIDNSGNVGIGTTSPVARLDVVSTNNNVSPLFTLASVASNATTTQVTVTSTGNTGIGTTTPGAKVHAASSGTVGGQVILEDTAAGINMHMSSLRQQNGQLKVESQSDAFASTTVATFATSTTAFLAVGTSTQEAANVAGTFTSGASASTTIILGSPGDSTTRAQWEGTTQAGATFCMYVNAVPALVVQAGACNK